MGNEYLYQIMAQQNIETFARYDVKKIVTVCPHCFNTIKNEYPHLGGDYQVLHYSEFVADLIAEGKLKPLVTIDTMLTYHDSCYLGRHNGVYDAPRKIAESIPGLQLREMERVSRLGVLLWRGRRPHVDGGEPRQAHQPHPHRSVPRNGRRHGRRLMPLLSPDVRGGHRFQRLRS